MKSKSDETLNKRTDERSEKEMVVFPPVILVAEMEN